MLSSIFHFTIIKRHLLSCSPALPCRQFSFRRILFSYHYTMCWGFPPSISDLCLSHVLKNLTRFDIQYFRVHHVLSEADSAGFKRTKRVMDMKNIVRVVRRVVLAEYLFFMSSDRVMIIRHSAYSLFVRLRFCSYMRFQIVNIRTPSFSREILWVSYRGDGVIIDQSQKRGACDSSGCHSAGEKVQIDISSHAYLPYKRI